MVVQLNGSYVYFSSALVKMCRSMVTKQHTLVGSKCQAGQGDTNGCSHSQNGHHCKLMDAHLFSTVIVELYLAEKLVS